MRVLVFGDSITQGYWDTEGGWVNRIRKHYDSLQTQDLRGRDDPVIFNLGVSADTSARVLKRIESETIARSNDGKPAVMVQIGINDSLTEGNSVWVPLEAYKINLEVIIAKLQPLASKIIFVGFNCVDENKTVPVVWGDFNYRNDDIKRYEIAMADIAKEQSVNFIPVFDKIKAAVDAGNDFLLDGLHPNNSGHEFVAQIVRPELDNLLN